MSPSLAPPFCSPAPLQDSAPEAFASLPFSPGRQLSSLRAVSLLCPRHKPARPGPSPSPTPAFQRQVHLAGCPAPPAPTPVLGLRVVPASPWAAGSWSTRRQGRERVQGSPLAWVRPDSLTVPWRVGGIWGRGRALDPTRLDTKGSPRALAPPPTPSHQLLLALCGCASHLPSPGADSQTLHPMVLTPGSPSAPPHPPREAQTPPGAEGPLHTLVRGLSRTGLPGSATGAQKGHNKGTEERTPQRNCSSHSLP